MYPEKLSNFDHLDVCCSDVHLYGGVLSSKGGGKVPLKVLDVATVRT